MADMLQTTTGCAFAAGFILFKAVGRRVRAYCSQSEAPCCAFTHHPLWPGVLHDSINPRLPLLHQSLALAQRLGNLRCVPCVVTLSPAALSWQGMCACA